MTNRRFYLIIGCCLSAVFLYHLLRVVLPEGSLGTISTARISTILAVMIIIRETSYTTGWIRGVTYALFLPAIAGLAFVVMHWPFGTLLYFGSIGLIFLLLLIHAVGQRSRRDKLIVLICPLGRFMSMVGAVFYRDSVFWYIEWLAGGLTGLYLLWTLLVDKQTEDSSILDAPGKE